MAPSRIGDTTGLRHLLHHPLTIPVGQVDREDQVDLITHLPRPLPPTTQDGLALRRRLRPRTRPPRNGATTRLLPRLLTAKALCSS